MQRDSTCKICSEADINEIVAICNQSYREHYTYLWSDGGEHYIKNSFTKEKLLAEMAVIDAIFYLIYDEASPVGVLKINNDKAVDGTRKAGHLEIERIYFLKKAAGRGLGKSTLNMVRQLAMNSHKNIIWLKAMKGADAVQFYEKQAFVVTAETDLLYPFIKDECKRMVVMQLIVPV